MGSGVQFDKKSAKRIGDAVRRVEAMPQGSGVGVKRNRPGYAPMVLAKITASELMSASTTRYVYTITQIKLNITASSGTPSAVSTSDVTGGITAKKAINLAEIANTATVGAGVKMNGDDYPDGFDIQPIGGGDADGTHSVDDIVQVIGSVIASDGSTIYLIERMNAHDGTCSA